MAWSWVLPELSLHSPWEGTQRSVLGTLARACAHRHRWAERRWRQSNTGGSHPGIAQRLLSQSSVFVRTTHTCTAQLEQEISDGSCEMPRWIWGGMIQWQVNEFFFPFERIYWNLTHFCLELCRCSGLIFQRYLKLGCQMSLELHEVKLFCWEVRQIVSHPDTFTPRPLVTTFP